MASYTKNYELIKPTQLEHYTVDVVNENADKIDTALHGLEIDKETREGAQAKADAAADRAMAASIPLAQKGQPGGVASLDETGKLPALQLPTNDFDPSGAAETVQSNLDDHIADTANPHGVTAAQTGAIPATDKGASGGVASLDETGKVPAAQLPPMDYDPAGSASAVDAKLTAHNGDATKHITAGERTAWNSKAAGNHTHTAAQVGAIPTSEKGTVNGVASLDGNGKIVAAQMPDTGGSAEEVQAHLDEHIADTVKHVTAAERTAWDGKETPEGAKAKADQAEANAKAASRPVTWTPTAADVGAAIPSTQISVTLTAAGWTGSGPYTQAVSVTGLGAVQSGDIGLAQSATAEQRTAARDAMLSVTAQAAGSLTVTADGDKPTVDIPAVVTLLG